MSSLAAISSLPPCQSPASWYRSFNAYPYISFVSDPNRFAVLEWRYRGQSRAKSCVFCLSPRVCLLFPDLANTNFPGDALGGKLSPLLGGRCIDPLLYFKVLCSINTATNFILLALPIPLLWQLRTSKLQKLILTLIFVTGLT